MAGKLYIVGTPIGNLGDMSSRAVETLGSVDFIAAEDTRVTLKLLSHFGIKKKLISYYEHNKKDKGEEILNRIEAALNEKKYIAPEMKEIILAPYDVIATAGSGNFMDFDDGKSVNASLYF